MLHEPPSPGHAGDGGVVAHLVAQATGHVVEERQRMRPKEAFRKVYAV